MRTIKRIKPFLNYIERIWLDNPDLRFGQLLIAFGLSEDNIRDWNKEVIDYPIPFEFMREIQHWGVIKGYFVQLIGDIPFRIPDRKYIAVCDLDTEHIKNILSTQDHISPNLRELFETELSFRYSNNLKGGVMK